MRLGRRSGIRMLAFTRLVKSAAVMVGATSVFALAGDLPLAQAAGSSHLTSVQRHYLKLAVHGVSQTSRWGNPSRHWYNAVLHDRGTFPLAPIWDVFPLWKSVSDIALVNPSAAHRRAVIRFANFAESYWNPRLKPGPAYIPYPNVSHGVPHTHTKAFFDDNGWWGLAFLDAYKAVSKRRYLRDAERAFNFIARFGWDKHGGGIWWNNEHPWRSGEALAAAFDLSARLYRITHHQVYWHWTLKLITWANHNVLKWDGSYARKIRHSATMSHAGEGSMLSALVALCDTGAQVPRSVYAGIPSNHFGRSGTSDRLPANPSSWCSWAEALANKTDLGVPSLQFLHVDAIVPLNDNPQTDAVYVRGLLDLYQHDHNHLWYDTAINSATRILHNSRGRGGLFLRAWNGSRKILGSEPGMLRTQAASVSVFAALSLIRPFSS